jgi:hypothetical protein
MGLEIVLTPTIGLSPQDEQTVIDFDVATHQAKCWLKYWLYIKLGRYSHYPKIPKHCIMDINKCFNLWTDVTQHIVKVI